jgi:hypothetical protein
MSTKCTISYNEKYHLYQECYENNNVWLSLDHPGDFEVSQDAGKPRLKVAIPIELWRHMVEGWLKSQWASHPEWDGELPGKENLEDAIRMLNQIIEDAKVKSQKNS